MLVYMLVTEALQSLDRECAVYRQCRSHAPFHATATCSHHVKWTEKLHHRSETLHTPNTLLHTRNSDFIQSFNTRSVVQSHAKDIVVSLPIYILLFRCLERIPMRVALGIPL